MRGRRTTRPARITSLFGSRRPDGGPRTGRPHLAGLQWRRPSSPRQRRGHREHQRRLARIALLPALGFAVTAVLAAAPDEPRPTDRSGTPNTADTASAQREPAEQVASHAPASSTQSTASASSDGPRDQGTAEEAVTVPGAADRADETVPVDGSDQGRKYDGVGAVSAGASSRLLHDYPEPERSQILDYLFKPNYGAGLQILKVEIGGDTNSTSGAEPSHERERGTVDCNRGYEWWLMREAQKRNPDIKLGGLQWGAPGWFNGGFWSQDNIDYLLSWLDCAKQHNLDIDFMGGWNEAGYNQDWLIKWRAALQKHHPDVELTAADDTPNFGWRVADDMASNPRFGEAVDIANMHSPCGHRTRYEECSSTDTARGLGKPLWIGELSSLAHNAGAGPLARVMNRMYVDARISGMIAWSPISAWYSNITLADTGLMVAEWPWSGYYDVGDSIWSYAHTTQFAKPGWHYLNTGSTRLDSGATQATMAAPSGDEWSSVIETLDVSEPTTVTLDVANLPTDKPLNLWSSNLGSDQDSERFQQEGTVPADNGTVTLRLKPHHVYSLTTTDGQSKGDAAPQNSVHDTQQLPFQEDFDDVEQGRHARFFSDLSGAFEAAPCGGDRDGTCYRQQVTREPISWTHVGEIPLSTMFGDPRWWGDYTVRTDVRLEEAGHVEVGGRVAGQSWGTPASGYHLQIGTDGWKLLDRDHAGDEERTIASGSETIDVDRWHTVALRMQDDQLSVHLDGERLGQTSDTAQRTGNAALGASAYHTAQFDNVEVVPTGDGPTFVDKQEMSATASSEHGFHRGWTHEADHAVDDRPETTWSSKFDPSPGLPQSMTTDLGEEQQVEALTYQPRLDGNTNGMITDYRVEVSTDGDSYTEVASGSWPKNSATKVVRFPQESAQYVRLVAEGDEQTCGEATATAGEIGVVSKAGDHLTTTPPPGKQAPLPEDAPPEFDELVPQSELTAKASSAHGEENLACKAIDADRTTFWHSAPADDGPLPATLTLDLGDTTSVDGLSYLPRQDGNPNGTLTQYEVAVSADGEKFTTVDSGEWADNDQQKYATWDPEKARYVRLTAKAGHFDVASAAELHVATSS